MRAFARRGKAFRAAPSNRLPSERREVYGESVSVTGSDSMKTFRSRVFVAFGSARALPVAVAMLLAACGGSALPKSETITRSQWNTFEAVKASYDRVAPGTTTSDELRAMGFDPFRSANVRVLTYLDLMRQFLTSDAIKPADLDPAVQRCLAVRDFCVGYHIALERINRERKGSALADLLNFRRQTHETGWSFSALFLMQNGKVVYKLWSGVPRIDRLIDQDNPLGPVQEPATIIRDRLP
ncbi:MAG: hypothetical protein RL477_411 [Pseudomonadota bacterium]|jgi:hypothetical protein